MLTTLLVHKQVSTRLKEKGIKNVHGYGYGDLYVDIKVVTPTKLTDRQKEQ